MIALLILAILIAILAVVLGATLHGLFWLILIVAAVFFIIWVVAGRGGTTL